MFPTTVLPAFIAFQSTTWSKIFIASFQKFFPNTPILVVDNNLPNSQESTFLKTVPGITCIPPTSSEKRTHGDGIDTAIIWARENNYRYLVHFEPDCLISGTAWAAKLLEAVSKGAWMAGSVRKPYGPIHPTPSIWDLAVDWPSFCQQPRAKDAEHPMFHNLVDMPALQEACKNLYDQHVQRWFETMWDTGQKAWFHAAVAGKATLVGNDPSCSHFWHGSRREPTIEEYPQLREYL